MNWPVAPLLAAGAMMAGRHPHRAAQHQPCEWCDRDVCYSLADLGRDVGVTARSAHRWAVGGVPTDRADRAATALGLHPLHIWPDFYNDILPGVAA